MLSKINFRLLTNALIFQVAWFICVQGNNLHAIWATLSLLALHLMLFKINVIQHIKTSLLLLSFCLAGFLGDSLVAAAVYLTYSNNLGSESVAAIPLISILPINSSTTFGPAWLLCLWISFSTTMNHSMNWLFQSPTISFLTGLLLVPLSYIAGIKLSGSILLSPYWQFYILEGLWWAVLLSAYQKLNIVKNISQKKEGSHV